MLGAVVTLFRFQPVKFRGPLALVPNFGYFSKKSNPLKRISFFAENSFRTTCWPEEGISQGGLFNTSNDCGKISKLFLVMSWYIRPFLGWVCGSSSLFHLKQSQISEFFLHAMLQQNLDIFRQISLQADSLNLFIASDVHCWLKKGMSPRFSANTLW